MPGDLEQISFKLGEISGHLSKLNENFKGLHDDVVGVSKRVKAIEIKGAYDRGASAQNVKIAAAAGSLGGGLIAAFVTYCKSKGWISP